MRSLLISSTYFPPQTGGISRMMEQICLALGPERVSCLTGVRGTPADGSRLGAIRVYRRPQAFRGSKYLRALGLAYSLAEIALRDRPRVVQLASCDDGYLALLSERWLRRPFVVYAHGNEILAAMHSAWDEPRLALRSASCVIANSGFTASLVEAAGVRPEAIRIISPGCDTDKFRPRAANERVRRKVLAQRANGLVILSVGNLVERKGHDSVIRALPAVAGEVPGVTYVIVGEGPYRRNLEELASAVGVRDQVIFAGRVSDEELPEFYALGDVFAMPSRARPDAHDVEGFGIVFLEAGASGIPAVAGRSGGIGDAVLHGTTGLLVDPFDRAEIGQTLIRLLTNHELRAQLGRQSRERVEKNHTWRRVASHVQEILECVGTKRSLP